MAGERSEAYFRSMFPELQPHYHPEKLVRFVRERNGSKKIVGGYTWRNPPGFETAAAVVVMAGGREGIRLMDRAGALVAEFDYGFKLRTHGCDGLLKAIDVVKDRLTRAQRSATRE